MSCLKSIGRALTFVFVMGPSASAALAQSYPTRPVTIVVTQAAGGSLDFATRVLAESVSKSIGQRVVVENRPAGGGVPAAEAVSRAAPDGHLLLLAGPTLTSIIPAISKTPYDPINDFAYATLAFSNKPYVVTSIATPPNSLKELAAFSKTKKGGLSFGNQGTGYSATSAAGIYRKQSGADLEIINYSNAGNLLTDLTAGRVDMILNSLPNFAPALQDGKVKILAVVAPERSQRFPNIPTVAEAGFPDITPIGRSTFSLAAPAKTSPDILERIASEFGKAAKDADVIRRLAEQDLDPRASSPAQARAAVLDDIAKYGPIIKELNLKVESNSP